MRLEWGARASPLPAAHERCQRVRLGGATVSRQSCGALPPPALRRESGSRSTRSRRRAVKHEAVGGRMTARWSGAVPGRTAATPRSEDDLEVERRRVFPRRPAGSLQRWCLIRVLVTRNVGCRSGFRGILALRPRNAARHYEDVTSSDGRGHRPGTGLMVIVLAEGCSGRAKVERPERAPRSWCPAIMLACDRAPSKPRKACGGLSLASANPARGRSGPGLCDVGLAARRLPGRAAG
jgi:hypothetical protein